MFQAMNRSARREKGPVLSYANIATQNR